MLRFVAAALFRTRHLQVKSLRLPALWTVRGDPAKGSNPFDVVFAAMLEGAPSNVLVDPRDGCHYTTTNPHWPYAKYNDCDVRFIALPDLDAASAQLAGHRQLLVVQRLNQRARAAFDADAVDATCAHRFRLRKMRLMQNSRGPLLDSNMFSPMVYHLTSDFRTDIFYTREAVETMQTAVEHYVIRLMEEF